MLHCIFLYVELFHQPTLMHNFLYSLTICLLHYYPRHVSKHVEDNSTTNILLMDKENCALKLVDEIILYYDARSKIHKISPMCFITV